MGLEIPITGRCRVTVLVACSIALICSTDRQIVDSEAPMYVSAFDFLRTRFGFGRLEWGAKLISTPAQLQDKKHYLAWSIVHFSYHFCYWS